MSSAAVGQGPISGLVSILDSGYKTACRQIFVQHFHEESFGGGTGWTEGGGGAWRNYNERTHCVDGVAMRECITSHFLSPKFNYHSVTYFQPAFYPSPHKEPLLGYKKPLSMIKKPL